MTQDFAKEDQKIDEGIPVCEKCGNAMVREDGEWLCPHCQGEIDFMGEEDDE